MKDNIQRNSAIELIRIVAMFMIVFYHLILFFIAPIDDNPVYEAIQIPFHIGVILFVLISGYFNIRPSFKGFFKILCIVTVYFLPLRLWHVHHLGMGGWAMIDSFHVLSKTPYWFVRTYLCLYLVAPLINKYLENITDRQRVYIIFAFSAIAVYLGLLQCDITLIDGKNLPNFILIYLIGDTIHKKEHLFARIPQWCLIGGYLMLNSLILFVCIQYSGSYVSTILRDWSFPYYSPLLLLNSVLVFLFFGRFTFYSRTVNYLAASMFSVYIIHHQPTILEIVLKPIAESLYYYVEGDVMSVLFFMFIYSLIVLFVCVIIDKLLSPVWMRLYGLGKKIEKTIIVFLNGLKI